MSTEYSRGAALWFAGAFAFTLVTGAEAFWAWMTPGDFFANGNALVYPSYLVAAATGLVAGYRIRSWSFRLAVVAAVLASLWYCFYVPDGWWVHPPPGTPGI